MLSNATSRDSDPSSWDAKRRYVVPPPSVDYAAKAIALAQDARHKANPDEDTSYLLWRVIEEEIERD